MSKLHKNLSNAVRFLSIDAVEKANSGHPGMPMGMADVATVLFKDFLRFNPYNPSWLNRDRFVLSAGHGSMLLYSLLYLTGYKSVSLKDIKNFRQLNSICAGHPEYHPNTGIETTTGPLGQGISNAVGFAIAEEFLKNKFGKEIFNHKTYVLAGDGCLMEGVSHEALSLAGHLKLKNLVMLFDNNSISIDGPTNLAVSDDYKKRFNSYGWDYIKIDGHNEKQIFNALKKVQNAKKPTVISCITTIGFAIFSPIVKLTYCLYTNAMCEIGNISNSPAKINNGIGNAFKFSGYPSVPVNFSLSPLNCVPNNIKPANGFVPYLLLPLNSST